MGISSALGSSALLPAGLGFRNVLINGGFDIWQRSTDITTTVSAGTVYYPATDRWWISQLATAGNVRMLRQTADTTNFSYGCRVQRPSGQTATGTIYFGQTLETVTSKTCAGRQVTISFYAKKGANAVSTFELNVWGGKGTDQSTGALFSSGWTNGANLFAQTVTPTTTMTRYTYTFVVDSTYTQLALWFKWTPSGTAGADDWFQFEGVQLEANYQPTPFEQRPIGVELALCQRYYQKSYNVDVAPGTSSAPGAVYTAGVSYTASSVDPGPHIHMPTNMRAAPTISFYKTDGTANSWTVGSGTSGTPAGYNIGQNTFSTYTTGGSGMPGGAVNILTSFHWVAAIEL